MVGEAEIDQNLLDTYDDINVSVKEDMEFGVNPPIIRGLH